MSRKLANMAYYVQKKYKHNFINLNDKNIDVSLIEKNGSLFFKISDSLKKLAFYIRNFLISIEI